MSREGGEGAGSCLTSAGKHSTAFPDTSNTVREQHPLMVYRDGKGGWVGQDGRVRGWLQQAYLGQSFQLVLCQKQLLQSPQLTHRCRQSDKQ